MDDERMPDLAGKVVARSLEVETRSGGGYPMFDHYRIEFTDGTFITFHGGVVGYENATPFLTTGVVCPLG
jgi:hypothetical protein